MATPARNTENQCCIKRHNKIIDIFFILKVWSLGERYYLNKVTM